MAALQEIPDHAGMFTMVIERNPALERYLMKIGDIGDSVLVSGEPEEKEPEVVVFAFVGNPTPDEFATHLGKWLYKIAACKSRRIQHECIYRFTIDMLHRYPVKKDRNAMLALVHTKVVKETEVICRWIIYNLQVADNLTGMMTA